MLVLFKIEEINVDIGLKQFLFFFPYIFMSIKERKIFHFNIFIIFVLN